MIKVEMGSGPAPKKIIEDRTSYENGYTRGQRAAEKYHPKDIAKFADTLVIKSDYDCGWVDALHGRTSRYVTKT